MGHRTIPAGGLTESVPGGIVTRDLITEISVAIHMKKVRVARSRRGRVPMM